MVIQSIDSQKVHITILRVLYIFQSIKVRLKNLNIVRLIICRFGLKIILKSFGMQLINIQVRLDEPHHILQSLCQKNWIKIAV